MSIRYIDLTARKLSNLLFHINCNRNVIGDTKTLDDIKNSLESMLSDHEELLGKKFR